MLIFRIAPGSDADGATGALLSNHSVKAYDRDVAEFARRRGRETGTQLVFHLTGKRS